MIPLLLRGPAVAGALLLAAVTALAGCAPAPAASSPAAGGPAPGTAAPGTAAPASGPAPLPASASRTSLPAVTGSGVTALWQGLPWARLTFDGSLLLGEPLNAPDEVVAASAATGKVRWAARIPAALHYVTGLLAAGSTVIVEGEHPAAAGPVTGSAFTGFAGLDAASGTVLWTATAKGAHPTPPVAVAGGYLVTGTPSGSVAAEGPAAAGPVTGRSVATGKVAWSLPQPRGCDDAGLAGDGALLALSYDCGDQVVVERLDPATGAARWTWRSPAAGGLVKPQLAVTAASAAGGLVLLQGGAAGGIGRLAAALPHPRTWPALIGPAETNMLLALTAAGRPAWTETGAQPELVTPAGDALCEEVPAGFECRDDASGAPVVPAQVTYPGGDGSGIAGDPPSAAAGDGLIAAAGPAAGPGGGKAVGLRVISVASGKTVALARLGISPANAPGWNTTTTVVAAAPLTARLAVILVRRTDLAARPVLALSVPLPAGARGSGPRG